MKKNRNKTNYVWIDLADQFTEPCLAEARLRLRPRGYSAKETAKVQPDHIRQFFERVKVKGYLNDILKYLYENGKLPSFDLRTRKNERKVIIITGADTIRDATPTSHQEKLTILIDRLLSSLPDREDTTIFWFDSPVPSVEKAIPYSSRALIPFHETSSLGEVVTEIVWNLPVGPRGVLQPEKWALPTIGDSPMHDDIRVIVRHRPDNLQVELTHVPFLRGWSKRFRNRGTGLVVGEQETDVMVPDKSLRHRMKLLSLTMIPWLVKLWPHEILVEGLEETLEEEFTQIKSDSRGLRKPLTITRTLLTDSPSRPPSILDLVIFRLPETVDAKSFQAMTAGKINSQRLYRSPRKLQTQPLSQVSTLDFTEELPTAEGEVEQEWLFGIKFESDDDSLLPWWIVVQEPDHPSRMLVGCFTNRPADKDGFLWAETSQEMMKQSSADDILGFTQTTIIGRKGEDRLEIWSSCDSSDAVHEGALELKSQGQSTTGHLRAMRQTSTEEPQVKPSPPNRPSEVIYKRIVNSLRMHLATVTSPNPVHLRLEMEEEVCKVTLLNEWDTIIEETDIEYTADLISFLRWPMIKGGPLFTDSGEYVTWSVFDDIDFGELDFIRPYVTFTAARKTPKELPKRVAQFFDDSEELSMSIAHDTSLCPIALGEGVDHEKCWMIILPSRCPTLVKKQLGGPFTGEEMNGLLSPRRIYAGKLYTFGITPPDLSERDESVVFHEERYIRMFLREIGIHLKPLDPGTFLKVADQKWMITIAWEGRYLRWQAQSNVTGLFLKGGNHGIKLVNGNSVREECSRLLNIVISDIPAGKIVDYGDLEKNVLSGLKRLGYSKTPPKCELRFIDQSENICRYGVFLVDGSATEPMEVYCIHAKEPMSEEVLLEEIEASLDTSAYNIVNTGVFMEKLAAWVSANVVSLDEEPEEATGWTVMLSEDVETGEIRWTAECGVLRRVGIMFTEPKGIRKLGEEMAYKDMRDIFESEVGKELRIINNLDDVLEQQIPEIIRNYQENADNPDES
ncbi:MAG: hypothetical protein EAX87_12965 [Candidatus Thorarchaeota archaeon]|nr:hypothetical protein [Candidatus Thorarchaeota archaeon]